MSGRRWTVKGGLGGALTPRESGGSSPAAPVAANTGAGGGAVLQFTEPPAPASEPTAPAPTPAAAAAAGPSLSTMGPDDRGNLRKILGRAGLQDFYEPLLERLETLDLGPEDVEEALESGMLCEIGVKVFDAARIIRMLKEGGEAPAPPALRMREGQTVATANAFLFESKLSRYSAELVTNGGLQLGDIRHVTEEQLLAAGIQKEFHRKRFLREARNLGAPDAEPTPDLQSMDSDDQEPDHGEEPPPPELTSELDAAREADPSAYHRAAAAARVRTPEPEPEPEQELEPEPEPEPAAGGALERTGSVELQEFWSHSEPQAAATNPAQSAKAEQLFKMLSRTVADAPPDDGVFNRRFKVDRRHPLGRGAFGVVLRGRDRHRRQVFI